VVLYSPDHQQTFAGLGVRGAREVLDLWASRTAALGQRDDVEHVLIF
jgi:UDPglucose--hexose-1-phosphate uridylyltransferase